MAILTDKAPYEPDKANFLHDPASRPAEPPAAKSECVQAWLPLVLMVGLALGVQALSFTTRATWDGRRDWVVPVTTPIWVVAAVALAAVVWRRKWQRAAPALAFLAVGLVLTIVNLAVIGSASDGLRNALDIGAAVMYGCATVAAVVAWAVQEVRDPIKAPAPEV